jgi:hypothetical protein
MRFRVLLDDGFFRKNTDVDNNWSLGLGNGAVRYLSWAIWFKDEVTLGSCDLAMQRRWFSRKHDVATVVPWTATQNDQYNGVFLTTAAPPNTPTNTPAAAPTNTPTNTPTAAPTNTPTNMPTAAPTDTPTTPRRPAQSRPNPAQNRGERPAQNRPNPAQSRQLRSRPHPRFHLPHLRRLLRQRHRPLLNAWGQTRLAPMTLLSPAFGAVTRPLFVGTTSSGTVGISKTKSPRSQAASSARRQYRGRRLG